MRRRQFIALIGGAAVTWPIAAEAQRPKVVIGQVGILTGASGPVSDARVRMLVQALGELGWLEGRNLRLEVRHGGGDGAALRGMLKSWLG